MIYCSSCFRIFLKENMSNWKVSGENVLICKDCYDEKVADYLVSRKTSSLKTKPLKRKEKKKE